MAPSTLGAIMGLEALIVFCSFLAVLYFAVLLNKAKVPGSRFLLAGGVAVLLGSASSAGAFYFGATLLWLGWVLNTIGAIAAAYGFSRITRITIANHLSRQ